MWIFGDDSVQIEKTPCLLCGSHELSTRSSTCFSAACFTKWVQWKVGCDSWIYATQDLCTELLMKTSQGKSPNWNVRRGCGQHSQKPHSDLQVLVGFVCVMSGEMSQHGKCAHSMKIRCKHIIIPLNSSHFGWYRGRVVCRQKSSIFTACCDHLSANMFKHV